MKKISIPAKVAGLFIVGVAACITTIVFSTNDDLTFGAMVVLVIIALLMSSTTIRDEDRVPLARKNTYHKYLREVDIKSEHEA